MKKKKKIIFKWRGKTTEYEYPPPQELKDMFYFPLLLKPGDIIEIKEFNEKQLTFKELKKQMNDAIKDLVEQYNEEKKE